MSVAAETPPTMSELGRVSSASSFPPEAEIESLDALAAKVLARAKGVVGPPPSEIGGKLGRALLRLFALPFGFLLGALAGFILAPLMLTLSGSIATRWVR